MAVLKWWAQGLPFFLIKILYEGLSGVAWWEVCYILKKRNEDWRAFWLDDDTILLIRKKKRKRCDSHDS